MAKKKIENEKPDFPLQKENYILLVIGFAIILIGFLLMIGGKAENPNEFNPEIAEEARKEMDVPITDMTEDGWYSNQNLRKYLFK